LELHAYNYESQTQSHISADLISWAFKLLVPLADQVLADQAPTDQAIVALHHHRVPLHRQGGLRAIIIFLYSYSATLMLSVQLEQAFYAHLMQAVCPRIK
jgi:hypothetical protein